MPKRDPALLIEDMVNAGRKIQRYIQGLNQEAFIKDEKTIDAVIRNLMVIGEAAQQMPEDERLRYTQVPWGQIAGLRNRIVHDYAGVDLEIVWKVVSENIPDLEGQLVSAH